VVGKHCCVDIRHGPWLLGGSWRFLGLFGLCLVGRRAIGGDWIRKCIRRKPLHRDAASGRPSLSTSSSETGHRESKTCTFDIINNVIDSKGAGSSRYGETARGSISARVWARSRLALASAWSGRQSDRSFHILLRSLCVLRTRGLGHGEHITAFRPPLRIDTRNIILS